MGPDRGYGSIAYVWLCSACMLGVWVLLAEPASAARPWGPVVGRVGGDFVAHETGKLLAERPWARISASAAATLGDQLLAGMRVRLGVGAGAEDDSPLRYELLAMGTWLKDANGPGAVMRLGLGWYGLEVLGSDWTFSDRGMTGTLEGGYRLSLDRSFAPELVVALTGAHSQHFERNSTYPEWTWEVLVGVGFMFSG